jgi:hypothetical protein
MRKQPSRHIVANRVKRPRGQRQGPSRGKLQSISKLHGACAAVYGDGVVKCYTVAGDG